MMRTQKYWQLIPLVLIALCGTAAAQVPVPGPAVNVVASDPFNQKQVEVQGAANPNNPNHIFVGFIDYQTVVPINGTDGEPTGGSPTSSAWCGYSFSINGGKTWKNARLPGWPNDPSEDGQSSPIYGSTKCADPVVTWDTSGHAFFMGLAVRPDGVNFLFVSRFTDFDNGSGTLDYDSTTLIDNGNPSEVGQDLDKPSILFVPATTPGSTAEAGVLYACGTIFHGQKEAKFRNKVVCALSSDGGATYTRANQGQINGNVNTNNGTAITPAPNGGVYVFWRAFLGNENGFWFAKVDPSGNATTPSQAVGGPGFYPYDVPSGEQLARSNAFPTVATDASGRILLAFQAYAGPPTNGVATMGAPSLKYGPRIFLTYFPDEGGAWSTPRTVDYGPVNNNNTFQFMPWMAVSGDAFQIMYYDARNDGRDITTITMPDGSVVYYPWGRDRRFDVQVVQGRFVGGSPQFALPSVQVSQYRRYSFNDPVYGIEQGQIVNRNSPPNPPSTIPPNNPYSDCNLPGSRCPAVLLPNLSIGAGGTRAFIGDYNSLVPAVPLVRNDRSSNPNLPAWRLTNQPEDPQTFLAFFASTQDVAFPLTCVNGNCVADINGDWTRFIPAGYQQCLNPKTRDANIYFSAISPGIAASWSGTALNLVYAGESVPMFTVTVENRSGEDGNYRLTILDNPPQEDWSFRQTNPTGDIPLDLDMVETTILRNSSISLPVYYRFRTPGVIETPSAPVLVQVDKIDGNGNVIDVGYQTSVTYSLALDNLALDNLALDNLALDNLALDNLALDNEAPKYLAIDNLALDNLALDNLALDNASPSNLAFDNLALDNLALDNLALDNEPDQDITWRITNNGNVPVPVNSITNLLNGQGLLDNGYAFQLLIYQTQNNPGVESCRVIDEPTDVVISNLAIINPETNRHVNNLALDNLALDNLALDNEPIDEQASNATFVVNPGEGVNITLRTYWPPYLCVDPECTETTPNPTPQFTEFNESEPQEVGQAAFSTTNTSDGLFFDETPPVIECTANGIPCQNITDSDWFSDVPVKVRWTVRDLQSGIASTTGCVSTDLNDDTSGTELTCSAINGDGDPSPTVSVTIRIDTTPPTVIASATTTDGKPYVAGTWTNQTVTVSFSGTDGLSLVANCTVPVILSAEGDNQSASGTCTDNAGNTADPVSFGPVKIDTTAPTITGSRTPSANGNGWNNTDVTVSFECSDSGSGLAEGSPPAKTVLSSDGVSQFVTGTCMDNAGNSASATVKDINIDKTPPTVTASATTTADGKTYTAGKWTNQGVTVSFSGIDGLSGIANCSTPVTLSNEGGNQSASGTCTDNADNTAVPLSFGPVNIDKTPPTITITAPANNATSCGTNPTSPPCYFLNQQVASNYACSDAVPVLLSGVATCSGPVNNDSYFNTATVGSNTFKVTATDNAGNIATPQTNAYLVVYNFQLTQPKSTARLGSAVPLVWKLTGATGAPISDMKSLRYLYSVYSCTCNLNGTRTNLYNPESGATGKSDFRFNTTSNSFQFNWDTTTVTPSPGAGIYKIEFQLNDGSTRYSTNVQLK